jgi:hypothetical protein
LHNVVLFQNIDQYFYLDKQFSIYSYCYFCVFGLIFIIFFLTSLNSFNYNILTNHFVSIMSSFCFFSMLIEALVRILGYTLTSDFTGEVIDVKRK